MSIAESWKSYRPVRRSTTQNGVDGRRPTGPYREDSQNSSVSSDYGEEGPNARRCHNSAVELDDLEQWLEAHQTRVSQKQRQTERMESERLSRVTDELAQLAARRRAEELLEVARQQAEEEARVRRLAEEAAYRVEHAYELYVAEATAGKTPEERAQWLDEEAQLRALDAELAARERSMRVRQDRIDAEVGVYEKRVAAEDAARLAAAREQEEQARRHGEAQRVQRAALLGDFYSRALALLEESWESIVVAFATNWTPQRVQLETCLRARFIETKLTTAQRTALYALPIDAPPGQTSRVMAVIEMMELASLRDRGARSIAAKAREA